MYNEKITVGIFWLCDEGDELEIIYDKETRLIDGEDELISYSKQHIDVWKDLASKQFAGKYKNYDYDDFPRVRLLYDKKINRITIHYNFGLIAKLHEFKKEVENIFELDNPKWKAEIYYKSRCGKYN